MGRAVQAAANDPVLGKGNHRGHGEAVRLINMRCGKQTGTVRRRYHSDDISYLCRGSPQILGKINRRILPIVDQGAKLHRLFSLIHPGA